MTEKTIDPIFAPSVLEHAMAMFDDVNFDALRVSLIRTPKLLRLSWPAAAASVLVTKVASSSWKLPASPSSPVLPKCSML